MPVGRLYFEISADTSRLQQSVREAISIAQDAGVKITRAGQSFVAAFDDALNTAKKLTEQIALLETVGRPPSDILKVMGDQIRNASETARANGQAIDPLVQKYVDLAAGAAYNGKMLPNGDIPIQAWQQIKRPYKRLMSLFLDGSFHAILCGREGVIMEQDEDGEMRVTGTKLKAEGETPHEPHVLGRMCPERDEKGGYVIKVFFEKDRSGILTGKEFLWPDYRTIAPVVGYLCGGEQGKLGTPEEAAEPERKELFDQIRAALLGARAISQLRAAWSLTHGKKTRLGDELFGQLLAIKDSRKAELLEVA